MPRYALSIAFFLEMFYSIVALPGHSNFNFFHSLMKNCIGGANFIFAAHTTKTYSISPIGTNTIRNRIQIILNIKCVPLSSYS